MGKKNKNNKISISNSNSNSNSNSISNSNSNSISNSNRPFVSICTPTFNRRPFIPIMLECFRNQTYPRDRMEWIIIDDGTDKIQDVLKSVGSDLSSCIKYTYLQDVLPLGKKRNYMHSLTKGDIIVYMDDDDYYPPERVEHAVDTLLRNPQALCVGSSTVFLYFKHLSKMIQFGPYGPNHATAGTFAFRKELLQVTRYEDTAYLAEERAFLKEYTIPFAQLDPLKTILVFSHEHNTFDKRKLLHNQNKFMQESNVTVGHFIKQEKEKHIRRFFMEDIDTLLLSYQPGEPCNKPDMLKQMAILEEDRKQMAQTQMQQVTPIQVRNTQGQMVHLTMEQVVKHMQDMDLALKSMHRTVEQQRVYMEQQAEFIRECKSKSV